MPAVPRCSVVSQDAISGPVVKPTATKRSAPFAILILWASMVRAGDVSATQVPWHRRSPARGAVGPREGRLVVLTGGEPLLQLDEALIEQLHALGFEVAVETNGTIAAPAGLDWICVSPKAGTSLVLTRGNELKLIFPQAGAKPISFEGMDFDNFLLQPMDGPEREKNTAAAVAYCLEHPQWRLSLQTHKLLGIP